MGSRRESLPPEAICRKRRSVCSDGDSLKLMASSMLLLAPRTGDLSGFLLR
jgi:hypothetical protein